MHYRQTERKLVAVRQCLLSLEIMGVDISWWSHLADFVGHSIRALACFFVDCGHTK